MSYQDIASSRGRERELRSYNAAEAGSDKVTKGLIASVFRLQTEVSRYRADVDKLGSARDTVELRHKIMQAGQRISSGAQDIKHQLLAQHAEQKTQQTAKILSDFETTLKDFQSVMKLAKSKEAASLPRKPVTSPEPAKGAQAGDVEDPAECMALLQEQQRQEVVQLDHHMTYNEALIDERDQGIAEISQQITEVQEIFGDLAVLVNDQGEMLDDIEANISRVEGRTRDAGVELVKAERSQRKARTRMCCMLLAVGAVLAVLMIILLS
ncbi:hypothetical protein WJX72_000992 [[Myrmecia] bisecta]|uniref:t-SNARE coiled-coil homology domain-containing protein n=1 Tax=[Myrmecia] bisecta TaxID=41462 RepID=A0AAW1PCX9_9CHLO